MRYEQTAAGQAVSDLRDALAELRSAEQTAQSSRSWRDRHTCQAAATPPERGGR